MLTLAGTKKITCALKYIFIPVQNSPCHSSRITFHQMCRFTLRVEESESLWKQDKGYVKHANKWKVQTYVKRIFRGYMLR